MSHHDSGWEPKGVTDYHNGYVVHDHGILPGEINHGEVDGDLDLTEDEE